MTTEDKHRDSIHIADLSPDAQEALRRVVAKFRTGVKEHGPLNVTARRWGPELLNEAIDALHYCIFELMRLERMADVKVGALAGPPPTLVRVLYEGTRKGTTGSEGECTCLADYLRGGGVLRLGGFVRACDGCCLRKQRGDEIEIVLLYSSDDGLPLGGEWEALNAVK